jgi:hypothetical protein
MSDFTQNQLFYLDRYADSFITGICADDRRVVMGLLCPRTKDCYVSKEGHVNST